MAAGLGGLGRRACTFLPAFVTFVTLVVLSSPVLTAPTTGPPRPAPAAPLPVFRAPPLLSAPALVAAPSQVQAVMGATAFLLCRLEPATALRLAQLEFKISPCFL